MNKAIKVLIGIFFTYDKHKNWKLNFDLTFTNPFNYPIKILLSNSSTILDWKNISSTVYKVVLSLQMLE